MQREVVLAVDQERLYGHSSHSSQAAIKNQTMIAESSVSVSSTSE
jgi:hypothetical protein